MKILIVEDDHLQSEWLESEIKEEFNGVNVSIIETELEFKTKVAQIVLERPNLILMDIMLRWTNPSVEMSRPPEEIELAGIYDAGFRCHELLSMHNLEKDIPVILYSVLDKEDLNSTLKVDQNSYIHCKKDSDTTILFNHIRTILKNGVRN